MKDTNYANADDVYDTQCGEVFLTVKGNIVFQCTLCYFEYNNQFKGFDEYAAHIKIKHLDSKVQKAEVTNDPLSCIELCEPTLKEKEFPIEELKSNMHTLEEVTSTYPNSLPVSIKVSKDTASVPVHGETVAVVTKSNSQMDFGKILESVDLQIKKKRYKIEDRKYKCPQCDFAAKDTTNLAHHVRRHSNDKPHKCIDCVRTFFTKSELNTHRRTHTGERPFLCTDCGRAFMTSGMLSDHAKRHKNLRDKECTVCGMKFFSAKQLRAHIVVHSEDRLHKCPQCDKSFKQRIGLKNHMKLHANKKEYRCDFCNSSFNQSSGLYSHMKNKHTSVSPITETHYENPESVQELYWFKSSMDLGANENDFKTRKIKS